MFQMRSTYSTIALVLAMGVATTLAAGYGSSGYSGYGSGGSGYGGGYGMYGGGSSGYGSYGGGYGSYGSGYGSYGGGYGGYGSGYGRHGKKHQQTNTAVYIPYAVPVPVQQPLPPPPVMNPLMMAGAMDNQDNGLFGNGASSLLRMS